MKVDLSTRERQELKEIVKRGREVRVVKRAQALLWLAEGESARSVARRLEVKPSNGLQRGGDVRKAAGRADGTATPGPAAVGASAEEAAGRGRGD